MSARVRKRADCPTVTARVPWLLERDGLPCPEEVTGSMPPARRRSSCRPRKEFSEHPRGIIRHVS